MKAALLLAFCLAAAASGASAALTWDQKVANLKAGPDSKVVDATFHFTNSGKKPVDIKQIESSCGCTTTELDRRHFEPGESGDIIAHYTISSHVGHQSKTVAVTTSDGAQPVTLTLNIDIPELLRIRPSFVFWMQGEAPKPKTMTLESQPDLEVAKMAVQSSSPLMNPQLKEIVKGKKYELTITPEQTGKVTFSMMTVTCDYAGAEPKTFKAYATVKPDLNAE